MPVPTLSPIIEWRSPTSPFGVLSSLALTGTGYNGAVVVGSTSTTATLRIYNNFSNTSGVADATSCRLACYDDTIHQGASVQPQTTGQYLQVQVANYNGNTTGADTNFYAIGGLTKHSISLNSGTLSGTGTNYFTVNVQVAIPATATQGITTQGLWLEYSSSV
jgi:hypothetical protein